MRLRASLGSSGFDPQTVRGPSGSPVRALQVRLNRGSTSCTAHRRAAAVWVRHAIGLTDSSRARSTPGLGRPTYDAVHRAARVPHECRSPAYADSEITRPPLFRGDSWMVCRRRGIVGWQPTGTRERRWGTDDGGPYRMLVRTRVLRVTVAVFALPLCPPPLHGAAHAGPDSLGYEARWRRAIEL